MLSEPYDGTRKASCWLGKNLHDWLSPQNVSLHPDKEFICSIIYYLYKKPSGRVKSELDASFAVPVKKIIYESMNKHNE